jgi:hypothetical protein
MPWKKGQSGNPKGYPGGNPNPKWVKGVSGNPGGRAKDPFPKLIRESTEDGGVIVRRALRLLMSGDESIVVKAIQWLSDRGWGKAVQPVENIGSVSRMVLIFPDDKNGTKVLTCEPPTSITANTNEDEEEGHGGAD